MCMNIFPACMYVCKYVLYVCMYVCGACGIQKKISDTLSFRATVWVQGIKPRSSEGAASNFNHESSLQPLPCSLLSLIPRFSTGEKQKLLLSTSPFPFADATSVVLTTALYHQNIAFTDQENDPCVVTSMPIQ